MPAASIIILGRNESGTIRQCLTDLAAQTFVQDTAAPLEVLVVPNGCTDDTAAAARACAPIFADMPHVTFRVVDLPEGGKARSWNRAVHELSSPASELLFFVDADIVMAHPNVLSQLAERLGDPDVIAVSGRPVKDSALKERPSVVERFSLAASRETQYVDAINGSLYVARAAELRRVWMPNETPGEDGFLNAMMTTDGFRRCAPRRRVVQLREPTHYYEAVGVGGFVRHERRIIVGTLINRWLFEHMHSLQSDTSLGEWVRDRNAQDPAWVQKLVDSKVAGRSWVVPVSMVLHRLSRRRQSWGRYLLGLPLRIVVTVLTLPSVLQANATLRRHGAAGFW